MSKMIVDINVDTGEGIGNERDVLPFVSSCNIACGGHSGDIDSMRMVVKLCKEHSVKIGAHPSFPDRENFGRKPMNMNCADLYTSVKQQIRNLLQVLREEQEVLHHIKPHGALYNLAVHDKKIATVIIEVMKSIALPIKLYAPYGSVISELAKEEHIQVMHEAFADRNYNEDLTLVPRTEENAIILDSQIMSNHVFGIISREKVKTISGVEVDFVADTFCVHGDHPDAVNMLKHLHNFLKEKHIKIL